MKNKTKINPLLLLLLISLLAASACQSAAPSFPALAGQGTLNTGQPSSLPENPVIEDETAAVSLELAVPFSQETAQALGLLFLARQKGELVLDRAALTGHTLDLGRLAHLAGLIQLTVLEVPADSGISQEQLASRQAVNALPDIIYCSALASRPGLDQVLALDELLFSNELITAEYVCAGALDSLRQAGQLRALPYLASTPLLLHNKELLENYHLPKPAAEWSWAAWASWLREIERQLAEQGVSAGPAALAELVVLEPELAEEHLAKAILPYRDLSLFLPFVAPALNPAAGWAMWDGYKLDLDSPAFQSSAIFLRSLAGLDLAHLDEEQLAFLKLDQRNAFLGQIIDSASQPEQGSYLASLMPAGPLQEKTTQPSRLPARIRCLAVTRNSREAQLAADLAAFIALDPDALLLQGRFTSYNGLFPLLKDELVWQELMAGQPLLSGISSRLDQLYYGGQQTLLNWDQLIDQAFLANAPAYLKAAGPEQQEVLQKIKAGIGRILNEGG